MRIISKRTVISLVLYSSAHIDRLEKAGGFPKRVRLSPSRVGWLESEIQEWIRERTEARDVRAASVDHRPG